MKAVSELETIELTAVVIEDEEITAGEVVEDKEIDSEIVREMIMTVNEILSVRLSGICWVVCGSTP